MPFHNKNKKIPSEVEEIAISITNPLLSNDIDTDSSPNRPPKYPQTGPFLGRTTSFKPKTRFDEPSINIEPQTYEKLGGSPSDVNKSPPLTPRGRATKEKDTKKNGPDENEIYQRITSQLSARNRKRATIQILVELFVFLLILASLVSSLLVKQFEGTAWLGVELWKWFVLAMAIFSGMLITRWFVHVIVFLIEWKFMLKKNVVYFTHGLQGSVVVFIWIGLVLGTWCVLFKPDSSENYKSKKVPVFITMTLVTLLVGSFLWLLKTTLLKILASSFHMNRFFDRIQEAVFHNYVLQTLSGSPVVELAQKFSKVDSGVGEVSFSESTSTGNEKVVDRAQMKKELAPSSTMKLLVDLASSSGLSAMSGMLNEAVVEGGVELDDDEITSEEMAIATAVNIFNNVIGDKNQTFMEKADLHRFMVREEVERVYQVFEVNEDGHIDLKTFSKWVVNVYKDRTALQHALDDNKTAVDELDKILIGIVVVVTVILWLLTTEIASTSVLVFFSSQLLVAAFIFGNTCKTIFEAIIFVFVIHPFDVSDRCLIDGERLIVEEMNILTTVFLSSDNQKVYYPNSVLATKVIGNYYRSPDQSEAFNFDIDYRTPISKIAQLKEGVKMYLEKNPNYWHPSHSLNVSDIENINKIKMSLSVKHTMNFQDYAEKNKRRSELVVEMKKIFDSLEITYHLLPQEVLLTNAAPIAAN